jgi:4-diphosphocytidyl-2-C-methyl-D-erythritol kinase
MSLRVLCPAKVNLFLYVLRRRADGYHDLFSLMCRIGRYDEIILDPASAGIDLRCSEPSLPLDDGNLAVRAAQRFFEAAGRSGGIGIHLTKRIPIGAGLGGGSSNAASVLLGLNQLYDFPLSPKRLIAIGRSLGADVPFFLFQSPALASGIGDRLEAFTAIPMQTVLVVSPPFTVSTRMVYQNLNLRLTKTQKRPTRADLKKTAFTPALHLHNDLEAVTLALHPELVTIKTQLVDQGAMGALMSGSGPSVFGLFPDREAARKATGALAGGGGWRSFCADLLTGPIPLISEI